jgi:hypothetical protein
VYWVRFSATGHQAAWHLQIKMSKHELLFKHFRVWAQLCRRICVLFCGTRWNSILWLWSYIIAVALHAVKLWRDFGGIKLKVKQLHYRPWQALRVPGGWGSQILKQSTHEGGKVVSPTHRPHFPQDVSPEGLRQWKLPVAPSGIDPSTFRFVAQCLNQLRHRVPQIGCIATRNF